MKSTQVISIQKRLVELHNLPYNVAIGTLYLEYPNKLVSGFEPMLNVKYHTVNSLINKRSN